MHYNGFFTDEKGLEVSQGRALPGKARAEGGVTRVPPRYWGTWGGKSRKPAECGGSCRGQEDSHVCVLQAGESPQGHSELPELGQYDRAVTYKERLWPAEPAGGGSWGQGGSEGAETQGWQGGSQTGG